VLRCRRSSLTSTTTEFFVEKSTFDERQLPGADYFRNTKESESFTSTAICIIIAYSDRSLLKRVISEGQNVLKSSRLFSALRLSFDAAIAATSVSDEHHSVIFTAGK
jgi:hypothetical protein